MFSRIEAKIYIGAFICRLFQFQKQEYIVTLQKHLDTAKQKISSIPEETSLIPNDDLDVLAEIDKLNESGIYDTLRSPDRPEQPDRSTVYQVDGGTSEGGTDFESVEELEDMSKHETKLKHCPSMRSWHSKRSFVEEFTDIRNSLVAEINTAQAINTELKDSLDKDFSRPFSETEWLYERKDSEDLANSITQSYDLDNNRETFLYINSYIPKENSVYQVRSRSRSTSIVSVNSSETFSHTSVEIESSDPGYDDVTTNRQNATPNSQQHAAILRYYSYRHMNDKFNRYVMGRYNSRTVLPKSRKIILNDEIQKKQDMAQSKGVKKVCRWRNPNDSFV